MTWILTSCGRVIEFTDPIGTAGALPIESIAHSLATINRFTGHAVRPNSVAEHSLLVAEILEREHPGCHPLLLLAGLLHDAHECITNDIAAPAKPIIGPGWKRFESEWEEHFHAVFGLRGVPPAWWAAIKHADLTALATERRDLLPPCGPAWTHGVHAVPWVQLRQRDALTWQDWRQAFIDRYHELSFALQLRGAATHPVTGDAEA